MKYYEALQCEEWKIKRLEILERDRHKCTKCNSFENLHVHHTYYYSVNTLPWKYPNESLITLCSDCHNEYHHNNKHKIVEKKTMIEIEKLNWTGYDKDIYAFLSLNGKISIGLYKFKNKGDIVKFGRCLLDSLPIDEKIFDEKIVHFVHSLYKFHPKYNSDMIFEPYIYVRINEEFSTKYTNFVIVFEDESEHNFSNKKCAYNIK